MCIYLGEPKDSSPRAGVMPVHCRRTEPGVYSPYTSKKIAYVQNEIGFVDGNPIFGCGSHFVPDLVGKLNGSQRPGTVIRLNSSVLRQVTESISHLNRLHKGGRTTNALIAEVDGKDVCAGDRGLRAQFLSYFPLLACSHFEKYFYKTYAYKRIKQLRHSSFWVGYVRVEMVYRSSGYALMPS